MLTSLLAPIKLNIFKYAAVAAVTLLLLLTVFALVQHAMYRNELQKNATLTAFNSNLQRVNQDNVAENQRLAREMAAMEATLVKMAADQRKIVEKSNAELQATRSALIKLRAEHEKVSDFFSVPVPDEFVGWLRKRPGHPDSDHTD